MKDFFDEVFPLSKKQEEEFNKLAQTPMTLEEPPLDEPVIEPAYDGETSGEADEAAVTDVFEESDFEEPAEEAQPDYSYTAEHDDPIDEAFTYVIPEDEEEVVEEAVEETVEEALQETAVEVEDSPATLAFDFFDEPFEEEKQEAIKEPEEEKAPAVSHDEYLARLRQMNEIEEQLQKEIKSLGEQIDSVEMKVDILDGDAAEEAQTEDLIGFDYEYDERFFAEEETPAYKHPEIYKKTARAKAKAKPKSKKGELTINVKTLVGVGAAVATAIAAAKLLSDKDKK